MKLQRNYNFKMPETFYGRGVYRFTILLTRVSIENIYLKRSRWLTKIKSVCKCLFKIACNLVIPLIYLDLVVFFVVNKSDFNYPRKIY